jgi:hypothetical protein
MTSIEMSWAFRAFKDLSRTVVAQFLGISPERSRQKCRRSSAVGEWSGIAGKRAMQITRSEAVGYCLLAFCSR